MDSTPKMVNGPRPLPIFYSNLGLPLSTKQERKRASTRTVPRVIRTAPAISRIYPRRFPLQKPQFISFKTSSAPALMESRSYNARCGLTYFEQCFERERKIGEGSFGEVFRVKSKDDNKWYAVKRAKEPFRNSSDRELKVREVQKHELLPKHRNLVEFVRAWEERGRLFIQTELCEYSLADYAEREHNIPEEQLWFWFADLVAAIDHLHSHDLLHLDVKPENIFVTRDQVCKLGDFGLVFDLKKDTAVTAQDGDSKYLAPEVLNSPPGKPADIFSLGISILELATDLDLPSRGEGWHMLREGNTPEAFTSKLSPKLRHLIYWMMEREPEKRPTAQQLVNDVTIQHYLALRQKQYSSQVAHCLMEQLLWLYSCLTYAVYLMLWPIKKPISYLCKKEPATPKAHVDSPRRAFFYNLSNSTPESPSYHILPHSGSVVQRLMFDSCDSDDEERNRPLCDSLGYRCRGNEPVDEDIGSFERPHRRLFEEPDMSISATSSNASPLFAGHETSIDRLSTGSVKRTMLSDSPVRSPAHKMRTRPIVLEPLSDDADNLNEDRNDAREPDFKRTRTVGLNKRYLPSNRGSSADELST